MTDHRLLLIHELSEPIIGAEVSGLVMVLDRPYKAIVQREIDGEWEDVEVPIVFKWAFGELDDGVLYDVINGTPCTRIKNKWVEI